MSSQLKAINGSVGAHCSCTDGEGWITENLFSEWLLRLKEFCRLPKDEPTLLMLDPYSPWYCRIIAWIMGLLFNQFHLTSTAAL
jgi:hypothetical protein